MKYTLVIIFVLLAVGASATTMFDLYKLESISFIDSCYDDNNTRIGNHICLKTKGVSQRDCVESTKPPFQCFGNGCDARFVLPTNAICRQSFLSSNMDCYGMYADETFDWEAFYGYRELPDPRFDFEAFIACEQDMDDPVVKVDTCHILLIPLLKHSKETENGPFIYSDMILIPVNYHPLPRINFDFDVWSSFF